MRISDWSSDVCSSDLKTTILESSSVCPSCRHYLRFDSPDAQPSKTITPLHVEGKIRHPSEGGAWEYSVVLTIRDDEGNEIAHQVVGVGAMHPGEALPFRPDVEVWPTNDLHRHPRRG